MYPKNMMPSNSVLIECKYCKFVGYTRVKTKDKTSSGSVFCIICIILFNIILFPIGLISLCFIPCCFKNYDRVIHYCQNCKRSLGKSGRGTIVVHG